MEINFETTAFSRELKKLNLFRSKYACILDGVKVSISTKGNYSLYRAHNDFEVFLGELTSCSIPDSDIEFVVEYKKLFDIMKNVKSKSFSFDIQDDKIILKAGVNYTINKMDINEYPRYTTSEGLQYTTKVTPNKLLTTLENVLPAVSDDPTRIALNSVLLIEENNSLSVYATDTRRLAYQTIEFGIMDKIETGLNFTISENNAKNMLKVFNSVYYIEMAGTEKEIIFKQNDAIYKFKKSSEFFPHVKQVIPSSSPIIQMEFETKALQSFLDQIWKDVKETKIPVQLIVSKPGKLTAKYSSPNMNAEADIPCYSNNGYIAFDSIYFNGQFLVEGLTGNGKTVFTFYSYESNTGSQAMFVSGKYNYVVMPMKAPKDTV